MNKNILVFGATKERATLKLEQIVDNINPENIKRIIKSRNEYRVELFDGTMYKAISASDNARGHKCQKVYVDVNIDSDIVYTVIIPCLVVSDLPQNEQVIYF